MSYTPNTSYILASALNSTHRLIPLDRGAASDADNMAMDTGAAETGGVASHSAADSYNHSATSTNNASSSTSTGTGTSTERPVIQYEGHRNEKYSIGSCLWSRSALGACLLSGSEDGKVLFAYILGCFDVIPGFFSLDNDYIDAFYCSMRPYCS